MIEFADLVAIAGAIVCIGINISLYLEKRGKME